MYGLRRQAHEHRYVSFRETGLTDWSVLDRDWAGVVYAHAVECLARLYSIRGKFSLNLRCRLAVTFLQVTQLPTMVRITLLPPTILKWRDNEADTSVGPACSKRRCSEVIKSLVTL